MQDVCFEDLEVGHRFVSARRTLTEGDITSFSAITGDYSPLHADERFVREKTEFKGRIAQGWLVITIQSGLRSEIDRWAILAYLEMDRAFRAPAYPGATLEARYEIADVRRSSSKPDRGIVEVRCEVFDESERLLAEGLEKFLVAARERS